jgi:glycogen(starch) synthase
VCAESMRIMLLPNSYLPQLGGLEIAVANLALELTRRGHRVTVVSTSAWLGYSTRQEPQGVTVYRLPFALPRLVWRAGGRNALRSLVKSVVSPVVSPLCLLEFLRIIRRERPQILNVHYIAENAFYALAAQQFAPFRLVVNLHGDDIERHGHRRWAARRLTLSALKRADLVLSNSAHILALAQQIAPQVREKCTVVGNGVFPDHFRTEDSFPHPNPYVLSIGNLTHKKGFDLLIEAFARVRRAHPRVDLVVAGNGHEFGRCERLASQLDLRDAVTFLGRVDRSTVPALLNGCEFFVLPSRREPFGIVLLEAMAARKAVLATKVGGVPEIVTDMKSGLLVEPQSAEALAEGMDTLLRDAALGERLGMEGYRTVRERFTWPIVTERYIRAYEGVLGCTQ